MKTTKQHINGQVIYRVDDTEFFVYYNPSVWGQLKWVIDSENKDLLKSYLDSNDQLWIDRYEAVDMIHDFLRK